jgi:hypothetical protein
MNVKYYNNDAYIKSSVPNSFGIYANGTCDGSAVSSTPIDLRNNIFDGSAVSVENMSSVTENYNDIGGLQGNAGFNVNGSANRGLNDKGNVNPLYANPNAAPPNYLLQLISPLIRGRTSGPDEHLEHWCILNDYCRIFSETPRPGNPQCNQGGSSARQFEAAG